uniref:Leucine-rich repeats and guanylate kinase domain containing n=1 Tax=Salarias fasciatus TaxID=181472 RepID=A0A672GYQ3_SALFA
ISVLSSYIHLQNVFNWSNFSCLLDLSCVSNMPSLVTLDACHNEISNFFEFQPPKNLKEVKFSHNRMTKMKDLGEYLSLCKLDLDYNSFSEISGLQQCCKLTHLSLAHNKISRISDLDSLPLKHLCLRGNQLEKIEGLENLKSLQVLDLSLNRIASLSGLQNLHMLGLINLEKNQISEIQECKHIYNLSSLRDLSLVGNPVVYSALMPLDYYLSTQVASVNKYDPPLEVVAAREHMTHLVYQLMQPQVLFDSTLPSADSPYPMLVLTGPQGCGKRELAHRLCQEFSEYFAYGICHTTRQPYFGEENGIDYHFVSEEDFKDMVHMGKFIQTMSYGGHSYGLSREAIEQVAQEGLASCVHMELEGVFSLKNTYFEPRYILLIPTQLEKYRDHLTGRGLYTAVQIDAAVSRVELYANTNRQRPGFFDNVIACGTELNYFLAFVALWELISSRRISNLTHNKHAVSASLAATGHEPEDKPLSPVSRSGKEILASPSLNALDPSNPSYRSYFTRIQAELSSHKTPAVSGCSKSDTNSTEVEF